MDEEILTHPAFPLQSSCLNRSHTGMLMREYYLGKALQGLMANPAFAEHLQDDAAQRDRMMQSVFAWVDSCFKLPKA